MPTDNELDTRFANDLGATLEPLQTQVKLDCDAPSGFSGFDQTRFSCYYDIVTTSGPTNPVLVLVKGLNTNVGANTTNTMRIVKFKNPVKSAADILGTKLMTHIKMRIWSNDLNKRHLIYEDIDYRIFNIQNSDLAAMPGGAAKTVTIAAHTLKTYEPYTGGKRIEYTINRTGGVDIQPNTNSYVVIKLDKAFTFENTGDNIIVCGGWTGCKIRQYKYSNWLIFNITNMGAAAPVVNNVPIHISSTGGGLFKTPNYTQAAGYDMGGFIINGATTHIEETMDATYPTMTKSTPTVVVSNLYTVLNHNTYDHYRITITPQRASKVL
jgi:hypothetical protein